jgi:hypothetical protein
LKDLKEQGSSEGQVIKVFIKVFKGTSGAGAGAGAGKQRARYCNLQNEMHQNEMQFTLLGSSSKI